MRVKETPLSDIRPYPGNPRVNDGAVEAVAASIREFGWKQPIVVDADGTIIVGHTRYKAALALEMTHVPVVVASDLTPEQCAAYRLADNKTAELAEWDADLLALELDGLPALDMSAFGFDATTLKGLKEAQTVDFPKVEISEKEFDEFVKRADFVYWAFSGGRDSTRALLATFEAIKKTGKACKVLHVSSGCEFPDLEVFVRRICSEIGAELEILRPKENFLSEYAEKRKFPNHLFMDCVDRLVNRPINEFIKSEIGNANHILIRGGRNSQKKAKGNSARFQQVKGKENLFLFNPLFEADEGLLSQKIPEWRGYSEGFERTACWCCPFQSEKQWEALKKNYPFLWEELKEMFGKCSIPRVDGDSLIRKIERYWGEENGVCVTWC